MHRSESLSNVSKEQCEMMNLLELLIDWVVTIWQGDSDLRDNSLLGESPMDKKSRRVVGWICGSMIALLLIGGLIWWWRTGMK